MNEVASFTGKHVDCWHELGNKSLISKFIIIRLNSLNTHM